ncbi:MAG: hypothetical protein FWE98_06000 [Oscillospiraceae bacterium]|nr:hypothetical protein [Oscillospiraceae bacterium]
MPFKTTYALDSTALVLPYTISERMPPVYRFLLTFREELDPAVLEQAVRDLAARFPIMYTRLRRGFIWDFLEDATDCVAVEKDDGRLCRPFDYRGGAPLLRVIYRGNELAVECTHFTIDGHSATVYMFSLAARYLELLGHTIEKNRFVRDCRDKPAQSELADAFRGDYGRPEEKIRQVGPPAFQGPGKREKGCLRATVIEMPIDAMKVLLKEKYGGCTITEYLAAVYTLGFLDARKKSGSRKPVAMEVPGNLRHFWDTDTLRNFSVGIVFDVMPEQGGYSIDDVIELICREMKEKLTKDKMKAFIHQNVRYLKLLGVIPGFVKRLAFTLGLPLIVTRWPITSGITNIGYIPLPPSLAGHIARYAIILGRFAVNRVVCSAVGINNTMAVTISASNGSTDIQDFCLAFWERDGLPVKKEVL